MTRCTSTYKLGYVNVAPLLNSFDGVCPLCLKLVIPDLWMVAHHHHPERGGKHELSNLFVCCKYCRWDLGWDTVDELVDAKLEEWGAVAPAPTGLDHSKHIKKLNKLKDMFPEGYSVISL